MISSNCVVHCEPSHHLQYIDFVNLLSALEVWEHSYNFPLVWIWMCRYPWLFDQCTYPTFAQLQEAQDRGAVSPRTQDQVSFLNEVQITVSGCMCQHWNIWSPELGFFPWFTVHLQWVSEPEDKIYQTGSLVCFASMQLTLFHICSMSCRSTRQSLVEVEDSESSSEASDEEEQQERRPVRSGEKVGVGRLGRRGGGEILRTIICIMPCTACIGVA